MINMIERIIIRNYKSIANQTINLKNINIIIGANNSGKSNLLDAFVLYGQMLVMDLQEVFGPGPYSFRSTFHRGSDIRKDSINLIITSQNENEFHHDLKFESYRNLGAGPRYLLRIKEEILQIKGNTEKNSMSPHMLLRRKFLNRELDSDVMDIVRSFRGIRKYQFVPKEIKRERLVDPLAQSVPYLTPDGSNLVNVLYGIRDAKPNVFDEIMSDFESVFPDVIGLSFRHLGESKYALEFIRQVEGNEWRFLGPEISDGFVITLAIITLIHLPNALTTASKILLIEEIENGLNPNTLRIILERVISASDNFGIQFMITTHSPIILEHMNQSPEYIIVCEQDKGRSTYITLPEILSRFGEDYEKGESLFQLWFEGLIGGL
jgi:predicted ATPase